MMRVAILGTIQIKAACDLLRPPLGVDRLRRSDPKTLLKASRQGALRVRHEKNCAGRRHFATALSSSVEAEHLELDRNCQAGKIALAQCIR